MTKNEFLKTYKEVMGVDLTWKDVLCGLVVMILFLCVCAVGEILNNILSY